MYYVHFAHFFSTELIIHMLWAWQLASLARLAAGRAHTLEVPSVPSIKAERRCKKACVYARGIGFLSCTIH
jgi:hypothetical protein